MNNNIINLIKNIDTNAAKAIEDGRFCTVTVHLSKYLYTWGDMLHLTFEKGQIIDNNLRYFNNNETVADEAATYFIDPNNNLEDVDFFKVNVF